MYDQYLRGNTLTTGSGAKLPKHKGILFSANAIAGATFYMLNDEGNTFLAGISLAAGINILPIQIYSVMGLQSGLTAYRLN